MNVNPQSLHSPSTFQNFSNGFFSVGIVCALSACAAFVPAASPKNFQSAANSPHSNAHSKEQSNNPAELELRKRLEAAQAAQASGDPAAVAQANSRTIALALRELAQLRLLQTALPQAIDLYRRSLDFEDIADTHVDLAITQLQAGQYDDALAEASTALTTDPNNARALTVQSRVWIKQQQFSKAAVAITRAIQIDPAQSDVETMYSLGMCYLQSKDPTDKPKAAAVFEKMIQSQGDSGSLHVLFGRAYRDANDMPAAIHEFERAIALDPRTPHAHYFLGLARLAVNEWKATPEARAEFAKELEYYPHDYLANYLIGFLASGDRDYAVSRPLPQNRRRHRSQCPRTLAVHGPERLRLGGHAARRRISAQSCRPHRQR